MEEWKSIQGFELLYEISNLGRVKSKRNNKIIKQCNSNKYYILNLCKDGIYKTKRVHRLVAQHFIPNPLNLPCVCHRLEILDENGGLNNGANNLFWGTVKDNAQDRENKGRGNNYFKENHPRHWKGKFGKYNPKSKPINQYKKNGEFIRKWDSIADAERQLNIKHTNISKVCLGERTTAGGFKWKYTF